MKYLLCIAFISLFYNCSYAQLVLNDQIQIEHNDKLNSLAKYIAYHKFDYALVSWSTSTWINSYDEFLCLFIKNDKYSLVQIKSSTYQPVGFPNKLFIKQKPLIKEQADSLLKVLKTDSTFYYKQADFDKLPDECIYKKDGKIYTSSIMDAGTSHLARFVGSRTEYLTTYAADFHIENCYPYAPEYGILKAFVNTIRHLSISVRAFTEKKK